MLSAANSRNSTSTAVDSFSDLLSEVLQATDVKQVSSVNKLDEFLNEPDSWRALIKLLNDSVPKLPLGELRRELMSRLNQLLSEIDTKLNLQTNCIIHHPKFQELESGWRGLEHLVDQIPDGAPVKVRMLNASWSDMVRDQERAMEFDQSQLFRKVYSDEFGTPGGQPYGLLIGNYQVFHRRTAEHPSDDIATLSGIMATAAAAFAPFITSIHPKFLQMDSFQELEIPFELSSIFEQMEYLKWRGLREKEDSRFLGLLLPQVIYRQPYLQSGMRSQRFPFREKVSSQADYLWGNPVFAFAGMVARTFIETGWLAQIRGCRPGSESGGVISGLPAIGYRTGRAESLRSLTDVHLTDSQEKIFSQMGLISICHSPETEQAVIYSVPSVQKPKSYDEKIASTNAQYSSMLQHLFCVSRFAHYIKVMIRDRLGSYTTPSECEDSLQAWLNKYCLNNESASEELKARYPLSDAKVTIDEPPGMPGKYRCTIYLRPHFQLEQLAIGIKLTTQLSTAATS
jgi:type VI secretion system protein ImpD